MHTHIYMGGIIVTSAENGIGYSSSNPVWGCLYSLWANALEKTMNVVLSPR